MTLEQKGSFHPHFKSNVPMYLKLNFLSFFSFLREFLTPQKGQQLKSIFQSSESILPSARITWSQAAHKSFVQCYNSQSDFQVDAHFFLLIHWNKLFSRIQLYKQVLIGLSSCLFMFTNACLSQDTVMHSL